MSSQTNAVQGHSPTLSPAEVGILPDPESEVTAEQREQLLRREQLAVSGKLCAAFPNSANARFLMAMAYKEQGDSEAALEQLNQTLQRQPEHVEAWEQLGFMTHNLGDFERSLDTMKHLLTMAPQRRGIHLHIADILTKQSQFDSALTALRQEIALDPRSGKAYRLLGETHLQNQQYDEAKASLEKAVAFEPNQPKAYYTLATVCARLKEAEQARAYRLRFKELEDQQQEVQRQLRMNLEPLHMVVTSVAHTHTDVGRLYAVSGQAGPAELLWKRAAELDPQNLRCRMELAGLYQRAQRPEEALRWCDTIVTQDPDNGQVHYLIGNLQLACQRPDLAESAFERVVALSPQRPEGYLSLAVFYMVDEPDRPRAVKMAQEAVRLAPTPAHMAVLAEALWRHGDQAQAQALLQQAQQKAPFDRKLEALHQKMSGNP